MFKKRFLIILVTVLALALIGVSVPIIINNWPQISKTDGSKDHNYYEELTEFKFRITDYPDDTEYLINNQYINYPSPIIAKYVKQEEVIDERESNIPYFEIHKMAYIFVESSNNTQISVLIPLGVADNIEMAPDEEYIIDYAIHPGWPDTYRLVIHKDQSVIFVGISDWDINSQFNLSDFLPVTVEETKILTDHYISGGKEDFWTRKTNTEIRFSLNGDPIYVHQGQSGTLGEYDITLLIARETEYRPMCYDCGKNSISYVISRKN